MGELSALAGQDRDLFGLAGDGSEQRLDALLHRADMAAIGAIIAMKYATGVSKKTGSPVPTKVENAVT